MQLINLPWFHKTAAINPDHIVSIKYGRGYRTGCPSVKIIRRKGKSSTIKFMPDVWNRYYRARVDICFSDGRNEIIRFSSDIKAKRAYNEILTALEKAGVDVKAVKFEGID